MIRQSKQAAGRLLPVVLAICIAAIGMPPVLAAPTAPVPAPEPMRAAKAQVATLSKAQIDSVRSKSIALQASFDPREKERGARLSLLLDVFNAKTPEERHAAIRRLPVRIVESAPSDGRVGVLKTFIAGGRVRAKLFVPAVATRPSVPEIAEQPASGPGLKLADAAPSEEECTLDGVTGPCATQQELEDALIVFAECEAENEYLEDVYYTTTEEIEVYCAQNPYNCDSLPDGELVLSGPNACTDKAGPCASKGWLAFGAVLVAVGAAAQGVIMASAVVAPPVALLVTTVTIAVGATIGAAAAAIEYINCKTALVSLLPTDRSGDVFEPVY